MIEIVCVFGFLLVCVYVLASMAIAHDRRRADRMRAHEDSALGLFEGGDA